MLVLSQVIESNLGYLWVVDIYISCNNRYTYKAEFSGLIFSGLFENDSDLQKYEIVFSVKHVSEMPDT